MFHDSILRSISIEPSSDVHASLI